MLDIFNLSDIPIHGSYNLEYLTTLRLKILVSIKISARQMTYIIFRYHQDNRELEYKRYHVCFRHLASVLLHITAHTLVTGLVMLAHPDQSSERI